MNEVRLSMSQGVVSKHLYDLIAKQVDDHALVVWYDPEGHYRAVASGFTLPNTTVARLRRLVPATSP